MDEAAALTESERIAEVWPSLSDEERVEAFRSLPRGEAGQFFLERRPATQATLLLAAPEWERRLLVRLLAPDDAADVIQELPSDRRGEFLGYLDDASRREVAALLAYAEDEAGGLMSPRFARLRPEMTIDEAVPYVRRQAHERTETIHYLYVLDAEQRLLGVVSFRELLTSPPDKRVREVMSTDLVTVDERADQEVVAALIAKHDLVAVPVVDEDGRMRGIVTVDDVVDVVQREATEDIQKIGGSEALDEPYLRTGFGPMVRKRAGWLALLFVGQMLTVSAMAAYAEDISAAVVLALFLPLIISSGGNSGSQSSTLVVRAMALGEVRLRDWWTVVRREILIGLVLGCVLASIGMARVFFGESFFGSYGAHFALVALVVGLSVVGVVVWGTVVGSTLPFLLRRLRFDPASASAPLVATIVDVSGVLLYFTIARWVLTGALL